MSAKITEQQEITSLQARDVRVYLPPSWLTRRFAIVSLIGLFTVGPLPVVLLVTAGDQYVRNRIDDWMSDPDIYNYVTLRQDEYERLPVHWRQVIAELAARSDPETAAVRELIRTLTTEHIELVDRIAPYMIQDFIIRDSTHQSQHPIPALSVADFAMLEDLGILQSVQQGHEITPTFDPSQSRQVNWFGTTLALAMTGTDSTVKLPITRFTEPGRNLMRLLRVPSHIGYFEWLAKRVEQSDVTAVLWAIGIRQDGTDARILSSGRIHRDSIPTWPETD